MELSPPAQPPNCQKFSNLELATILARTDVLMSVSAPPVLALDAIESFSEGLELGQETAW